jgi:TRAP-type C4-dicarboxylate transport system substrate-binding protein
MILGSILLCVACGGSSSSNSAQTFKWKLQCGTAETYYLCHAFGLVAKELNEKSKGRLTVTVYYNNGLQLPEANIPTLVRDGAVQMGELLGSFTAPSIPETDMLGLPGLVPTPTRTSVLKAAQPFFEQIFTAKWNQLYLGTCFADQREIMLKQVPTGLASIRGQKIRAAGASEVALTRSLGAIPVDNIKSPAEIYPAFQSGLVTGVWGVNSYFSSVKMGEVGKGELLTDVGAHTVILTVNKDAYNALPGDLQSLVKSAGAEGMKTCSDSGLTASSDATVMLQTAGVTVVHLTATEQAQIVAASRPIVDTYLAQHPEDKDFIAKVQAAAKQ